ncbi:hypothetical protein IV38_GL001540 [Lactobacillus selangorensis]|uniref:Lipoprotein n=1 Tax=Lactobacillus selangorensis TaxID=81857 RepID=A0A0R2FRM4_9LACO|nr:hypothetical protein [Lactobacillus selangorensis]KRN28090.1 hypothetical protein IV38_GL001540 [Lactobacillus selangorensis]KRN31032.1 hypothetical protein IV40_GL001675 [Lactobacillus selangorensis]
MNKKLLLPIIIVLLLLSGCHTVQKVALHNGNGTTTVTEKLTDGTNTTPAYYTHTGFMKTLIHNYPQLKQNLDNSTRPNTYVIPGLRQTKSLQVNTGKVGISKKMDPQGLATTYHYLIISAYSHDKKYNSVLYILDKKTGQYLREIVLPDNSHVGGIAYDSVTKRLWVTTENQRNQATLSSLSAQKLRTVSFAKTHQVVKFDHSIVLPGVPRSSFLTYHHNALYVGYFGANKQGRFIAYPLTKNGLPDVSKGSQKELRGTGTQLGSYTTDKQLQGVAFYQGKILFSQSYGPQSSKIMSFDNDGQKSWIDFDNDDVLNQVIMPPYLEQITVDGSNLYAICESGAAYYRKTKLNFYADRVMKFKLKDFVQ